MSVTGKPINLEQSIATLYARYQPGLARNEFPTMAEQALRLLAWLAGLVVAPGVAANRWQDRYFITVFSTQTVVQYNIARLIDVPVEDVKPVAVRKVLSDLSIAAWEGLAPGVSYPAEMPHVDARNHFKQALVEELKRHSQQPLEEHTWGLLANLVDDCMLRNYQRTWIQTLRADHSPTALLMAQVALLPLLQNEMRQAFPTFPTLGALKDFEQVFVSKVLDAPAETPNLASIILVSLTKAEVFHADSTYALNDKRPGLREYALVVTGGELNAFTARIQRFSELPVLQAVISEGPASNVYLDRLAEAYARRLELQTRLAGADAMLQSEHLQVLRKVWKVRDAGTLYGDASTAAAGQRVKIARVQIKMPAGSSLLLQGVLVIGTRSDTSVFLVAPHLGIEVFDRLATLRAELERRFNEPGLMRPWLRYLQAHERALAGFHNPSAKKGCELRQLKGDVFRHLAHSSLKRLVSDLEQAYQQTCAGGAIGSLSALDECLYQRLDAEMAWVTEAVGHRTRRAIETLDKEPVLQAWHLQARPGVALPLLGLPEALTLGQVLRALPPKTSEPVPDDVHVRIAHSYFAGEEVTQMTAWVINALPDYHQPDAGALPGLAMRLVRRLWDAPAGLRELSGVDQSERYKVFQYVAALRKQTGQASVFDHLVATNTLLMSQEPFATPPESAFTCDDWISAQDVTHAWRRGVVHRHINGRGAAPDVEALCTFLGAPPAFEYAQATPEYLVDVVNPLLAAIMDSPAFHQLEQALLKPAGWPADTGPERRQALVLSAITDYLYPADTHRAGYLCGFNLYDPSLGEHCWQLVLEELWAHLRRHFAGQTAQAVSLAAVMLLRRYAPALLVRGIPDTLLYGHTPSAVDFRHAVAMAEATVPGLAWRKGFAELETLSRAALQESMTPMQQAACAALRSDASIYFAMCRGKLSARSLDKVSDDDAQQAIAFTHEDGERREKTLNALLEPPPDRKEMACQQLKIDAPLIDPDQEKVTSLTEKERLKSSKIRFVQWLGSLVTTPEWAGPIMSNVERYMTDVDGYGFDDGELGFESKGLGGPALSRRFNEAYDLFEQAYRIPQRQQMKDAILDLPADQRRELLSASQFVSVSFKGAEDNASRLGHFGLLAVGSSYIYELFCPSGTIRKVAMERGPDVRTYEYREQSEKYRRTLIHRITGLPALDVWAHTEGREGSTVERCEQLNFLFSNSPHAGTELDHIEALCNRMVDKHFTKVISQLRTFYRRRTDLERYYQRWSDEIDTPLTFIVPFYSLYLDLKNDQVSATTVVFGALELITFLLPFRAAFRAGYSASVSLGRVVARTTSLGVSKIALGLAKAHVAIPVFTKVLVAGVIEAMNPLPWQLLALLGRAGWSGVRALSETLWRLRQIHTQLGTSYVLGAQLALYTGWRSKMAAPSRLLSLSPTTLGRPDAVARSFLADFSWGNRKLSIADQVSFHARDVDLAGTPLQNHVYRLGPDDYIRMQGNLYQVLRMPQAGWRIVRGARTGPVVEYAQAEQQWRLAQGGLSGGMLASAPQLSSPLRVVALPMDGVAGLAPDYHVRIADEQVNVYYDANERGWRERSNDELGAMVWRDPQGHWQRGTIIEFRNRPQGSRPAANVRTVELPRIPEVPLQLEPIPAIVHYIWVGRQLPGQDALDNVAANVRSMPGFQSILHVDLDTEALQRLTGELTGQVPGLQIRNLNDEPFFQNLTGTRLGDQYRHIIDAAQPYYPAASQVLRYPLMNAYGGIYLDLDNALLGILEPGNLTSTRDGILLGSWVDSPLGSGYEPSRFASRPDNQVLRAISAEMTQRYQIGRAHYDSIAPRETSRQVGDFYREHSRLTGAGLFNQVLAQTQSYPVLPQMRLMGTLGVYDRAYELALYRFSVHQFPFATRFRIQAIRPPHWQQALAQFAEPLSEPMLLERMQALNVTGTPSTALTTLRGQGRSNDAIARTLSTMEFQRGQLTEVLGYWRNALACLYDGPINYRVTFHLLMIHWQINAWASELNQPRVALQLGSADIGMLPHLPSFFYQGVHGLQLGPLRSFNPQYLSRFSNLSSLEIECQGISMTGLHIPAPHQVPRLTHLSLRNLNDAAYRLTAIRNIRTLQSLDLSGAIGLVTQRFDILDLTGFTLRSIVLDRCQLTGFPQGDFTATERLSLAGNAIVAVPYEVLTNSAISTGQLEVVLRGNPLTREFQAQVMFAMGENRRYRFTFDDSQVPDSLRREVEGWRAEAMQIREVFTEWAQAGSSSRPLPDTVVESRRLMGERMLGIYREYRGSSRSRGMQLTLEQTSELPPANLPEQAYRAVAHLELSRPALSASELGQFIQRFQGLISLVISGPSGGVTRLPEALRNLPQLYRLDVVNLGIVIDQQAMDLLGSIRSLGYLELRGLRLGQIDNANALAERFERNGSLILRDMEIEQFPEWIDSHLLSSLEELDLSGNRLVRIPEDLFMGDRSMDSDFDSEGYTEVTLTDNPFDPELSQRLHDWVEQAPDSGPRFNFYLDHSPQLHGHLVPGPGPSRGVAPWLEGPEIARRRLIWQGIEQQADATYLMTMVNQLLETADFRHSARRPALIESVWMVLAQAQGNAILRSRLNEMAEEGARMRAQGNTCSDGVRAEFFRIETEAMVHQAVPQGVPPEQRGAYLYPWLRAKYRADAVEVIANRQARGRDVAEVRLVYLIGTRESLGLLNAPRSMLYAATVRVQADELSGVEQEVIAGENQGGLLDYAPMQPFWTHYLREHYADRFDSLEAEYQQRVLGVDDHFPADSTEERVARITEMEKDHEREQEALIRLLTLQEGNAFHDARQT